MKNLLCIIFWLFPITGFASALGTGSWSLGVSQFESETEYGADLEYELDYETNNQTSSLFVAGSHSTGEILNSGITAHTKLYERERIIVGMDNDVYLLNPSIHWISAVEFESTELFQNQQKQEKWGIFTGPSLSRNIRRDVLLNSQFKLGRDYSNENISDTREFELLASKQFPSTNTFNLLYDNTCWDYTNDNLEDNCIDSLAGEYVVNGSHHSIELKLGESKIDESKEAIYALGYFYRASTNNEIRLQHIKEVSNLKSRLNDITSLLTISEAVTTEETSIEFNKTFKRLNVSLNAMNREYETSLGRVSEKERLIEFKYSLRSKVCTSCSLILSSKASTVFGSEFEEQFFGLDYPIRRHLIGALTLRRTHNEIQGEFYSLNLQIKYSGDSRLIMTE